jgi:putative DNA primase/helicase
MDAPQDGHALERPDGDVPENHRRVVTLSGKQLHEQATDAIEALAELADEAGDPRVLARGAELVRMTERGELEALTAHSLVDEMSRAAKFVKVDKDGNPYEVAPPTTLARVVLDRDLKDYGEMARVEYVVDAPVVTAKGALVTTPGYDPTTGIWYRPAPGLERFSISTDSDSVRMALDFLLNEVLGDFGFVEQADRANALALMVTPPMLPYINAPTPLFPFIGDEPGVGKTLAAQVALAPTCGVVPPQPEVRDPEEWRKNITTQLLAGVPAVLLDNLKRTLDSGALAAALTSPWWRDRMLGSNRLVTVPVRNAWAATANNLELSDELARRSVPIYLDTGDVKPSDRPKTAFRHPDLLGWALDNRKDLLEAVLTLVAAWLEGPEQLEHDEEGRAVGYERIGVPLWKPVQAPPLGSFDRWHQVVGGILQTAGVEGFLDNLNKIRVENVDDEADQMAVFVYAWSQLGLAPMDVRQLSAVSAFGQPLHEHLPDAADHMDETKRRAALGVLLRKYRGKNFTGLRVDHDGGSGMGKRKHWYVRGHVA